MSGVGRVGGSSPIDRPDDTAATPDSAAATTARPGAGAGAAAAARASEAALAEARLARARVPREIPETPTAIYAAAKAVAGGNASFLARFDAAKLTDTLERAIARADSGAGGKPSIEDLKSRSGAATLALALAKQLPAESPLRARLVDAYVKQMGAETERGLKASMALNLEAAAKAGGLSLSDAEKATLASAKEATLPTRPPYDEWFKDGRRDLLVKAYAHPDAEDALEEGLESIGFTRDAAASSRNRIVYKKEVSDPSGRSPAMPVRIDVVTTTEDLFRDMDDPNVQMEYYTGHSNLGGNVLGALAEGPSMQHGAKWAINWMCRGIQVLADVYNRFPEAHYTTTDAPSYGYEYEDYFQHVLEGIAGRKSYDEIHAALDRGRFSQNRVFLMPNDPRILKVRDIDKDGKVDLNVATGIDPLYNVGLEKVEDRKRDLRPDAARAVWLDPAQIPGDKVLRGVNFFNTFVKYHKEHANDGRVPDVADTVIAAGWFKAAGDEVVKVTERRGADGKTSYDVAVNSKYADQDPDAIGVAIAYELNRYFTKKTNGGQYTEQDKLRGAIFAGEYAAYMVDTFEECEELTQAIGRKYGFPQAFDWEAVNEAIDSDDHGYATQRQIDALKRKVGSVDPRIG